MNFEEVIKIATGHAEPFEYQLRLACGGEVSEEDRNAGLADGTSCESKLINIPTGFRAAGICASIKATAQNP